MIIVLLFFLAHHRVCAKDVKESIKLPAAGGKGWNIIKRNYKKIHMSAGQ